MAAKNLDEVLDVALLMGPLTNIKRNLETGLRDYAAHEVMRLEAEWMRNGWTPDQVEKMGEGARQLFAKMFGHISAFGGKKS